MSYLTQGAYPTFDATLAIDGVDATRNSVRLTAAVPWTLRASIKGEIDKADVVISSLELQEPIMAVPLELESQGDGEREFTGELELPETGLYKARLRVGNSAHQTWALTDITLLIWAHAPEQTFSPLALLDLPSRRLEEIHAVFDGVFGARGHTVQVINPLPADPEIYRTVLPHYHHKNALVIWSGSGSEFRAGSDELRELLDANGRLLVVSTTTNQFDSHTLDLLHIERVVYPVRD